MSEINSFNTEINYPLIDSQSYGMSSTIGSLFTPSGAVAVATDVAASLWNTLPGDEVDVEDWLGKINNDALKVYQEHPDAVNTASLIAGSFIPGGVALKGMQAARNGSRAATWFSNAGKQRDIAKAAEMFANGGKNTTDYKKLLWSMRSKTIANNVLDAGVTELAILGTLGAHPYLEDYNEDFAKNFGLSLAVGGALGSGIGIIQDGFARRTATEAVERGVLQTVADAITPARPTMPEAAKIQAMQRTISSLDEIIEARKAAGKVEIDDLLYGTAASFQRQYQKEQLEIFDKMLDGGIKGWDPKEQQKLLANVLDNNGFIGVESVKEVSVNETLKDKLTSVMKGTIFQDAPILSTFTKDGVAKPKKAVYYPESGKFGSTSDLDHHAGMSALKLDEAGLAKLVPDRNSFSPNHDASFDLVAKSTPHIEAEYGAWTTKFARMDDDQLTDYLKKVKLSPADLPQMQGIFARLENSSLALKNKLKVGVADDSAYGAAKANAILGEVDVARALGGAPLKYEQAAAKFFNNDSIKQYDLQHTNDLMTDWIAGNLKPVQEAASNYFAKGMSRSGFDAARHESSAKFAAIYESPQSVQLRADLLSKLADSEGKIYVYRGVNAPKIFGQAPLESMALTTQKAAQFAGSGPHGKTLLYKIDVDDVVAGVKDIGPRDSDNVELVVRASAREAEATLSSSGQLVYRKSPQAQAAKESSLREASSGDLREMLMEGKYKLYQQLIMKGYPEESIAKRLNLDQQEVQRMMAGSGSYDEFQNLTPMAFKNADSVAAANQPSMRPLEVSGNLKKANYTTAAANLNARNIDTINHLFVGNIIAKSESETVRTLGAKLLQEYKPALDIARQQLARINNEAGGNRFFSDTVQFTRMMGDLGPIFSSVGKEVQELANKTASRVVKPIGEFMAPVSKDIAALTEFSVANNLQRSQAGWRIYKDRQFWHKVKKENTEGKMVEVLEPIQYQGKEFMIASDATDNLLTQMQAASKDLYHLANTPAKITGSRNVSDIGFWSPSWNPIDKHVAYVHDAASDVTQVLYGKSLNELEDAIKAFAPDMQANPALKIVRKGDDQALWSKLNGRLDPIQMKVADTGMQRSGSGASAIPRISTDVLAEVAGGYEHYINANVRNLGGLLMDDIVDALEKMSAVNQTGFKGQALSAVKQATQQPKDVARSMKNLLLGSPSLGEYEGWKNLNRGFESALSFGTSAIAGAWNTVVAPVLRNPLKKGSIGPEDLKKINYEEFARKLEESGTFNPFAGLDDAIAAEKFGVSTLTDSPDVTKRLITSSNALAATVVLRFGELAHPLVNLVSMPILTTLANSKALPESFMGVQKASAQVATSRVMYDGIRAMNSDKFAALRKVWEDKGYFTPLVSEATDVLRASRSFEKGPVAAIENGIDSNLVKFMSKPADASEGLSRRYMMHTGYLLGKRMYPELGDDGLTIFARDFMDKALGNYSASQRPVFFQGTMGMAMGLFQTYMLTLAQSMYRNVEVGDWKSIGKAMLAQNSIFGFSSMPGFDPISKAIGENFSDDNVDLTTGIYRAMEGPEAEWFLYGAPSNLLGSSIYSRGDIAPRFPNVAAGLENLPAANFAMQSVDLVKSMANAAGSMNTSSGQAMLEALSLQTMSRPLARMSEVASAGIFEGGSVTRGGLTVQTAEEVLTFNGIAARVLATRPMEESKLRQAEHLRTYYGAADRDNRKEAVNSIRTSLRAGELDPAIVERAAEKYFRNNGTPTGWNSAFQEALATTSMSGNEQIFNKLREDDPLQFMINSL